MTAKWLVVTGGARGIGAVIARLAAKEGFSVAIWDTDEEAAAATAGQVGDGAMAARVDVTDEDAVRAAFAALPALPDAVVNNAGIVRFGPLLDVSVSDWEQALRVNLTGSFIVGRCFARLVRDAGADQPGADQPGASRAGGGLVNIASINGVAAAPFAGGYSSSKAAIVMLTQQMALEWAPLGLRVNCVAPGLIDAGMSEPIYADRQVREQRQGRIPLSRLGTAEEVAATVLFLVGSGASYLTGQTVVVDGGITISALGSLARPASVDSVGG
ncbi:MAG TPA: SDR family NAD(P)-dependent oxidoreductase [Streptosporangiaceae bacterium]|nr:SDR family NAD(P)-dependent oxidoreductase [Streptosporangiaceae bacterium]